MGYAVSISPKTSSSPVSHANWWERNKDTVKKVAVITAIAIAAIILVGAMVAGLVFTCGAGAAVLGAAAGITSSVLFGVGWGGSLVGLLSMFLFAKPLRQLFDFHQKIS